MNTLDRVLTVFNDKRFLPKVAAVFCIYLLISGISWLLGALGFFSSFFSSFISPNSPFNLSTFIFYGTSLLVTILMLPFTIYLKGYTYMIADRMRRGLVDALPEHNDLKKGLRIGGANIAALFGITIPVILLVSLFAGILLMFVPLVFMDGYGALGFGLMAGVFFVIILMVLLFLTINAFFVPSFMYIYLKERSIAEAFSPRRIWGVIQVGWEEFLMLWLFLLAVAFLTGVLGLALCCLGPFLKPLIQTVTLLLNGAFIGAIYYKLDQKFLEI